MILQALTAYYDRVAAQDADSIAPPGFSYEQISFAIVLNHDGKVVAVNDLRSPDEKGKPQAQPQLVPQPPKRSGKKPPPCFLWDKTSFALGMEGNDKAAVKAGAAPYIETPDYLDRFKEAHAALVHSSDPSLAALGRFLATWQPSAYATLDHAADMIDRNVVFRLDGDDNRFVHDSPAAKALWQTTRAQSDEDHAAAQGICLVLGDRQSIARLHPAIKGVRGAQQAGGSIVSFNQDSFTSYGKDQGFNAPVSEQAAFAYTTALNHLLRRGGDQKLVIGDATTVYWAEAGTPAEARAAEEIGDVLFRFKRADDQETSTLRTEVMDRLEAGRGLEHPRIALAGDTRFYILGLAPNQARLSIRFWETTTLGDLGDAFHQHYLDLRMETPPRVGAPPSLWLLTLCTAPYRRGGDGKGKYSTDDIAKPLAGELLRAVMNKQRPYPATLLTTLVMRIRSDGHIDHLRASLVKACIVRRLRLDGKLPNNNEEYLMRTDPNDEIRRLGRLFALLEQAQFESLGDVNSSFADKYLGSAAATPARVFPPVIELARKHYQRMKKGHSDRTNKAGQKRDSATAQKIGRILERRIEDMASEFKAFRPQLSVEEQGLFFIGFFQERSETRQRAAAAAAAKLGQPQQSSRPENDDDDLAELDTPIDVSDDTTDTTE